MIKIFNLLALLILISTKSYADTEKDLYCRLQIECKNQSSSFFYAPKLATYDCTKMPAPGGSSEISKLKHEDLIRFISYQYKNLYRFYDAQTSEEVINQLNNLKPSNIFNSIADINSIFESTNDQHVYFNNYNRNTAFRLRAVLPVSFDFVNSSAGLKVYVADMLKSGYVPEQEIQIPGFPNSPNTNTSCLQKYADFLSQHINEQNKNVDIGDEIIEYDDQPIADLLTKNISVPHFYVDVKRQNLKNLFLKNINYKVNYLTPVKLKIKKKDNSIKVVQLEWIIPHGSSFIKKSDREVNYPYYFITQRDSEFAGSSSASSRNYILTDNRGSSSKSYVLFSNLSQFFTYHSQFSNKAARIYESISGGLNPTLAFNSDGVIIDLRGNRGGQILDAHYLARAFADQPIEPIYYDARVNNEIKRIVDFNPLVFSYLFKRSFYEAYSKGLAYTRPEPKFESVRVNELGQIYKTKVIVLVDSLCFSACEVFVALLKGQPNVRIIGYGDMTTAGGGASMWNMSEFYYEWPSQLSPLKFPYDDAVNVNFSFEANYQRMKDGSLKPIQGHGVEVDQVVEKTYNDIVNNDADLYEKLFTIFETF